MTRPFVATLAALAFICLVLPSAAPAQECPGNPYLAGPAAAKGNGRGTATLAFVSTGPNCTVASMLGDATRCHQRTQNGTRASFTVVWASTTARTMDATGGCRFNCPGGTCFVDNQGLPVELLHWEVR